MFGWCSGDHNHHPSNPPIRSQTLNNHNSSKNRVSRAFLEVGWCRVLPPKNKQTTKTLFLLLHSFLNSVNDFLLPAPFQANFAYLIRKFYQSEGWFVFTFWDSKHLLALSKAVHKIDFSQRVNPSSIKMISWAFQITLFHWKRTSGSGDGEKKEKDAFSPKHQQSFFVPSLQIHRTNPSKARICPQLFFVLYPMNWTSK